VENFNKKFNARNPLKCGKTSGEAAAYSSATPSPLGYSPFKQMEEETVPVEGEQGEQPGIVGQDTSERERMEREQGTWQRE